MLGKNPWYFSLIRKYVILMGSALNDIHIERTVADSTDTELIKVPVSYATKEKMLARLQSDPDIDRPFSALMPRISFELVAMQYDSNRKLPTVNRRVVKNANDLNTLKYLYSPVPYDFMFNAYVYVKNAEDGTKIIEQIIPFFTPDYTVTAELIPEMGISKDISIVLGPISPTDMYDQSFINRRALVWELSFTVKGELYGPIREKPIIKFANTSMFVYGANTPVISYTVQPGLTANEEPTSNASATIDKSLIAVDDDFGFVTNTIDYIG